MKIDNYITGRVQSWQKQKLVDRKTSHSFQVAREHN